MKKTIKSALSTQNGIIFYSNKFSNIGFETFIDYSGKIQTRITSTRIEQNSDSLNLLNRKITAHKKRGVIIFDILLLTFSIICFIFSNNFGLVIASLFFSSCVSSNLFEFIKTSYSLKTEKIRSCSKFHAAEHMVVNAYEKLQKIPTLEEVKNFSRFHKKCGSNIIISQICTFSIFSLVIAFLPVYNYILFLLGSCLTIIFCIVVEKYSLLRFFQVFVTSKPSDKELLVAIEGIRQFELLENHLQNKDDRSEIIQLLREL